MNEFNFTVVSGYWRVNGKYSCDIFEKWFDNTLRINCPYIFFGDEESIEIVKKFRKDLPTHYIKLEINEFYSYKYKNNVCHMLPHVPSTEVNLIWNEKINLVERAKEIDPYKSNYFMWIDAGIYNYRNKKPSIKQFPDPDKIKLLPIDKFIFCTTDSGNFEKYKVHENNYYHYISGNFIIPKNIVNTFAELYRTYIDKYLSQYNWLNTEQKILTHLYNDKPELFYQYSVGYGSIVKELE